MTFAGASVPVTPMSFEAEQLPTCDWSENVFQGFMELWCRRIQANDAEVWALVRFRMGDDLPWYLCA